ncbi:unnamed protein product [Closterium sp. Naga37s-1]|nr:unnamed protein product [Closterium sp. Naga37s-1]
MDVFEIEKEAGKARQAAAAASAAAASAAAAVEGDGAGLKDHFKPLNELPAAQRQKELHKEIQFVEHTWPLEQLYSHFHTDPAQGLSEVQVVVNRGRYGENRLTPGYVMPWWVRYLLQFTNFFSLLLIVAAALCFLAYGIDPAHGKENLYLGIVLVVVVVVTASFTYWQEARSEHIMESFRQLIPATSRVLRNGRVQVVDASELVPGDVVELSDGDKVPADIRLIHATDLTVDNSALTGESAAVERGAELAVDAQGKPVTEPLEAANLVFYATIVASGHGKGVVIGTGDNTAMGQIAGLSVLTPPGDTPLAVELKQLVGMISLMAVVMGLVFFGIALLLGDPFLHTVVFGIGVIVANVPEGLMAAVTVSLALAAKRMHVHSVLVKNLQAVETLGSCTVIASDKTGTLTQNRMTVRACPFLPPSLLVPPPPLLLSSSLFLQYLPFSPLLPSSFQLVLLCFSYSSGPSYPSLSFPRLLWSLYLLPLPLPPLPSLQPEHCWYDLRVFDCPVVRNRVEWEEVMPGAVTHLPEAAAHHLALQQRCLPHRSAPLSQGLVMGIEMRRREFDLHAAPCAGDASEQGLLKFVEPLRPAKELRDLYAKLFEIKFSSATKWQLSIHVQSAQNRLPPVLVMKGAPETVLERCSYILVNGQVYDLTSDSRKHFQEAYQQMGGFGERVLGMAFRDLEGFTNEFAFTHKPQPNFPTDGLTFVGMVSLMDPPRPGVPEAVAQCRRAAVKVIMVTGDHPITATAIATKVGILESSKVEAGSAAVVTGDDIRAWSALTPREEILKWDEALSHHQVIFARVSPSHKLLLVEHCQRRGEIVAVTGDGVNDAPALKKADIGIAMGIAGKDVSKEAADMILMDDNFASIVSGVEEGRLIFDNLKKTICYALTVNVPQLIPYLVNVLLGVPLALSTVLMLAICLGTDMLPAISLAYEEKESDIMDRPPRNPRRDRLVSWRLISHAYLLIGAVQTLAGFLAYLAVFNDYGFRPNMLQRIGFDFARNPIICTFDRDNEPYDCGYGCGPPNYSLAMPDTSSPPAAQPYCYQGCPIPSSNVTPVVVDPFSEMGAAGFKGQQFCALTCNTSASAFPGGVLPSQCSSPSLSSNVGFPGRQQLGKPLGPYNGWYWWAGRKQLQPNTQYQVEVLRYAQSAYFVAVIVTQWANLLVCKTRRLSLFQQGMRNHVLTFSLFFETLVAAALLYWPFLQEVFDTRPLNVLYWFIGVPFALTILAIGELRKWLIRKFPGGWMDRWTNW